jgi:hypothetical protein
MELRGFFDLDNAKRHIASDVGKSSRLNEMDWDTPSSPIEIP